MFCTVSVARESSELALLSLLSLACIKTNAPKQEIRIVMKNLPRIVFRILSSLAGSIRRTDAGFTGNEPVVSMVLREFGAVDSTSRANLPGDVEVTGTPGNESRHKVSERGRIAVR